jgi:hypothetical protein
MQSQTTVDEVIALARRLSPTDQSRLIAQLRPDLSPTLEPTSSEERAMEELYARGYEQVPEDVTDVAALLPHLPLAAEGWE